jgi:broad specificity polyphosphatase/5'/3'-nucleotidase SurE
MQSNTPEEKFIDNIKPCTLETIDFALFNWVDKTIDVKAITNDGFRKIPVIWASAERAFQIKNYKDLRDKDGTLITPFISVERGAITKDPSSVKGAFQANLRGFDRISFSQVINQEKTSKYANNSAYKATKKLNYALTKTPQVVYQTKSIRIPTYINVDYTISIKTNYLQQMNDILHPFIAFSRSTKHFLVKYDDFRFEAFMGESFETEENASELETEERQYITKLTVKVTGYLIGDGKTQDSERVKVEENAVSIKLPKENITFIQEETKKKSSNLLKNAGSEVTSGLAVKKTFSIGNNADVVYTVTHNLNTRDMYVSVRENFGTYDKVEVAIGFIDLNNISIDMGDIVDPNNEGLKYIVTIIG